MFEYEYRLHVRLHSIDEIRQILCQLNLNINTYTVKYVKYFRQKNSTWEIKQQRNSFAVYHLTQWFKFVESEEISFNKWSKQDYKLFYQSLVFNQQPFTIEHRYQIDFTSDAKLYGYAKNNDTFGLVFELEVQLSKHRIKNIPLYTEKLNKYEEIFNLFSKGFDLPYELGHCQRKRVYHTRKPVKDAYVAVKHDGVFGLVLSYKNYIYEKWEGNDSKIIPNFTLGNGIVFAAEKMKDETIILLDVYEFRGLRVLNVESIFFDFLPSLKLPMHYKVQTYKKKIEDLQFTDSSDGIIYHTLQGEVYKYKPNKTIDLLYEKGCFILDHEKIPTSQSNLKNGVVYECDLNLQVIKERPDRFVSNSREQVLEAGFLMT